MFKYIPFLKFKQNEIQGVLNLSQSVRDQIVPLYDIPRSKKEMSEGDINERLRLAINELEKSRKIAPDYPFIIDNYDLDDTIDLAGVHQYRMILTRLASYPIVPTLAFDRHRDHNNAALDSTKKTGGDIAIRLQRADLESYNLTKIHLNLIWPSLLAAQPRNIILLVDLRMIDDFSEDQRKVERFMDDFNKDFKVFAVVLAGSIIPAKINDLIQTNESKHVTRDEYILWRSLQVQPAYENILFGDYSVVSPEYSDLEMAPEILNGISAPKIFYAYNDKFFVLRGRRFKTHTYKQYFDISDSIVKEPFYRGNGYSTGDSYIYERSSLPVQRISKTGSPSTWIKSLTTAHVTFIVNTV